MDSPTLISALLTIAVGAIAGGITNAVAIWMLFHPYESRGLGPFRIQGAIPKNKGRLAKSIGKTVGEKLLTAEDLSRRLAAPEVRAGFDGALSGFLDDLLERERGPLLAQLPPDLAAQLEAGLDRLAAKASEQLAEYAATPAFAALVTSWLERLRTEIGDRPIGELLTPDRRASLQATVEGWLHDLTEGPELEAAVRHFVEVQLERLGKDDRPLIDRLPLGLVGTVEQSIHDYLPVAIERIGAVLSDPEAKGKIHQALRTTFDRSVRDLLLHERLLARIVVTDQTFTRLLDGLEREGFERFAESLSAPDMRAQLTRAVNDGLVNFLRIPLSERLARMGPKRAAWPAPWATGASRSCATKPHGGSRGAPWIGCSPRPSVAPGTTSSGPCHPSASHSFSPNRSPQTGAAAGSRRRCEAPREPSWHARSGALRAGSVPRPPPPSGRASSTRRGSGPSGRSPAWWSSSTCRKWWSRRCSVSRPSGWSRSSGASRSAS
jgi:hypothetical protein